MTPRRPPAASHLTNQKAPAVASSAAQKPQKESISPAPI